MANLKPKAPNKHAKKIKINKNLFQVQTSYHKLQVIQISV
jgi:hypothetical protein